MVSCPEGLFPGIGDRPDRLTRLHRHRQRHRPGRVNRPRRAFPPGGEINPVSGGCAGVAIGLSITATYRIEIEGAEHRFLPAFSHSIAVRWAFCAVADGIAVAIGSAAFFDRLFALTDMVDADAIRGGNAGV
jgi:hypothetical protein